MARVDDPISVVEAAWRLDGDDADWLKGIGEAARACLDRGHGAFVFRWRFPGGKLKLDTPQILGGNPAGAQAIVDLNAEAPPEGTNLFFYAVPCGTVSQLVPGMDIRNSPAWQRHCHPLGLYDAIGLNAAQPDNTGLHVSIPLREVSALSKDELRCWQRVVVHLSAADRLRRALAARATEPEAVLSSGGRTVHAEGPAKARSARDALRDAVLSMERARSRKGRADGEAALAAWRAMVAGRWSLLDVFERDGRRYIVARRNAPEIGSPDALSVRERQVAAFASMGHSNKLIAYELGLAPSTVATHLGKAMTKLGVASRVQLLHHLRLPTPPEEC
jgi:DNA-binding CsgD family transcriptional regulator